MKYDFVYILGTGSKQNDFEIKHSIRSIVKNANDIVKDIYIIGEKPPFFDYDKIKHIPAQDLHGVNLRNEIHKLRIACSNKKISDDFVLMNDDFFIKNPIDEIAVENKGLLSESISEHTTKKGSYYNIMCKTDDLLGDDANDFSLHTPFIYNKVKLLEITKEVQEKYRTVLLRTFYANKHQLESNKKRGGDVKIKTTGDDSKDLQNFKNEYKKKYPYISTDDDIMNNAKVRDFIAKEFTEEYNFYEK